MERYSKQGEATWQWERDGDAAEAPDVGCRMSDVGRQWGHGVRGGRGGGESLAHQGPCLSPNSPASHLIFVAALVSCSCCNKFPHLVASNNRNFLPYSSGGPKSTTVLRG